MISQLFGLSEEAAVPHLPPSLDPASQLMAIRSRLDALELACAGLWELLKSRAGFTDEEIAGFIREVDLRDGKLDGKDSSPSAFCPSCSRRLLGRGHKKCLWCGAELPQVTAAKPSAAFPPSVSMR